MKPIFLALLLGCFSSTLFSQYPVLEWAISFESPSKNECIALHTDVFGNIYVAGNFYDTQDFDPGVNQNLITSEGGSDIYITKTDPNGNLIWVKTIGDVYDNRIEDFEVNSSGEVILVGFAGTNMDFDPGSGVVTHQDSGNGIFVLNLDSNGDFNWVKCFQDIEVCIGSGINSNDEIFIAVHCPGDVDFDPGLGVSVLSPDPALNRHPAIVKLSSSGLYIWAKEFIHNSSGTLHYLKDQFNFKVDDNGNSVLLSRYKGDLDLDPNSGTVLISTNSWNWPWFAVSLDNNGDYRWGFDLSTYSSFYLNGVGQDENGNTFLGLSYYNSNGLASDMDPTGNSIYSETGDYLGGNILKILPSGMSDWAYWTRREIQDCNSSQSFWCEERLISFCSDDQGNLYALGMHEGKTDFDNTMDSMYYQTIDDTTDITVSKLDDQGNLIWTFTIGDAGGDNPKDITMDDNGNLIILGEFTNTPDFDPNFGTYSLSSVSEADPVIIKFDASTLELNEKKGNDFLSVFPNPTNNTIQISGIEDAANLKIFNTQGQLLKQIQNFSDGSIDFSTFDSGIYILSIELGGQIITKRIIRS